jgi:glycosyltransferase involved in cell wall biosynthesis
MVQCSRAEGFGLPIIEALSLGTPSIYTPWGGPLDFSTEENCWPVKFELVESDYHVQSSERKSFWAEVDRDNLKYVMRYVFSHREENRKKGEKGKRDMQSWTSRRCAMKVVEFVREVEAGRL